MNRMPLPIPSPDQPSTTKFHGKQESFTLIGASRVGISLAYHLSRAGFRPGFVWNRSPEGIQRALKYVAFDGNSTDRDRIPRENRWLIISVRDDVIAEVAGELAGKMKSLNGVNAFHTSGFLDAGELHELKRIGAATGSLHPVLSVTDLETGIAQMAQSLFTCEGEIQDDLRQLVTSFGAKSVVLTAAQKKAVHISAVFANNYSVSLIALVKVLCREAGLDGDLTRELLLGLSEQAVRNGWQKPLREALTGPIARGDRRTVRQHLDYLEKSPEIKDLYRKLADVTQKLLEDKDLK